MTKNTILVRHDLQHQMFVVKLNGGAARLKYNRPEKDVWEMKETYVPESFRNNGVAGQIVEHALDHAKRQNIKVIPTCPFVENYIDKHPRYEGLVLESAR